MVNENLLPGCAEASVQRLGAGPSRSVPRFLHRTCRGKRCLTVSAHTSRGGQLPDAKAGQKCPMFEFSWSRQCVAVPTAFLVAGIVMTNLVQAKNGVVVLKFRNVFKPRDKIGRASCRDRECQYV